ncbi:MAG: CtsR family transcriptional regulator [Monoglobales bacterium]
MGVSDRITAFITALLEEEQGNDWLELKRNELAQIFGCVPSQINYVISTRFNPQHGYEVESKRGGGGFIKIRRIDTAKTNPVYRIITNIGTSLTQKDARAYISGLVQVRAIDEKTADVMAAALSDSSIIISQPQRDIVRANILKNMLTALS